MIDVVAAVNDDAVLTGNLRRSPILGEADVALHLQTGYSSASLAFREAMLQSSGDILVFAHQDVYLPAGWRRRLLDSIAHVEAFDPQWAVLGVYGVTRGGRHVGYLWSSGLGTELGAAFEEPVAVESIDEVLIVLRRGSGIEFDTALPGYHLYATDLVQSARACGHGCYVVCAPVVHNSRPCRYLRGDYFAAYDYIARKWQQRLPIRNNVAIIVGPGLDYWRLRARHLCNAARYGRSGRKPERSPSDCVLLAQQLGFE